MANWTSPVIFSVAEEATSPLFNQYQRDNLQYLYDRFLPYIAQAEGTASLTLVPGMWLMLALFKPTSVPSTCSIRRTDVIQVSVTTNTTQNKHPSLVFTAGVSAATEAWTAVAPQGQTTFWAARVAV
jgi:hypothetical protein